MPTLGALIRQLRDEGWKAKFGDNEIRLALDHRAIWVFGDGYLEFADDRAAERDDDQSLGRGDDRWAYALGILGVDSVSATFDARTHKWGHALRK